MLHIKVIGNPLFKMRPHYVAAMAHQEVFQQPIIINQLIRGRLRWGRGARVRRKAASREIYDQLMVELRKEDHRTFKISSATQMNC